MSEHVHLTRRTDEERARAAEEAGTTPIFELDGVTYSIANRARPALTYAFLKMRREKGDAEAGPWIMEQMLGADAIAALASMGDDLTSEMDDAIQAKVTGIALGGAKLPKG